MFFDMSKAPAVVRLAWDHLLAQARVSPVILRLCVEATYETEPARGIHLKQTTPTVRHGAGRYWIWTPALVLWPRL